VPTPAVATSDPPAPAVNLKATLVGLWRSSSAPKAESPHPSPLPKGEGTGTPGDQGEGAGATTLPPQETGMDARPTGPPEPDTDAGRAVLPADPPPLKPLPPGAVGSGTLDKPCKCGSRQFVDVAISDGRSRRDCHDCGWFLGWGKWYEDEGEH
jgi:hypothetical protein